MGDETQPKSKYTNSGGKPGRSGPPGNQNRAKHGYYLIARLIKSRGGVLDRRTILGRHQQELEAAIAADLGGDLSVAQRMLVRDVALDTLLLEGINRDAVAYQPIRKGKIRPVHQLRAQLIAQRREHLKLLGLKRIPRDLDDDPNEKARQLALSRTATEAEIAVAAPPVEAGIGDSKE